MVEGKKELSGLTEGRIVHYVATQEDADRIKEINNKQKDVLGASNAGCNGVAAGDHLPMMIVRVWNKETGYVNGKVFLDGSFDFWVTSVTFSEEPKERTWHWIERA